METTFLVIFTLLFLFFQTYGTSSDNIMITAFSNVTCVQRERQSLLLFRQGLTDKSNRLSTWTRLECCEWQGVGCDRRNGHVVKLDLRSPLSFMDDYTLNTSSLLEGKVSPFLINLKHLRYLDLSMNNFSGQNIPEFFGSFKYLEYLNLSHSGFSGVVPPHLGNLSRLQYLDLKFLYMVSLPYDMLWVSLLSSLKHLDLSGINIGNHTNWLHSVNMLTSLVTLNLAWCDINIPSIKYINFTSLNALDLSYNGLRPDVIGSTIPVWLSNLTSLKHLNLIGNSFHGQIPDVIGTLSSLASIHLSFNKLSGPIPPSLGGLSSLRVLDFSENQLSGSIPESIGQLSMLENLDLASNQLGGSIPESIGQLSMLENLDLASNQLGGSIPESIGLLTRLQELHLSHNQGSGNIPESIGLLTRLRELDLSFNQLSGSIPESIGLLTRLERLNLRNNQLSASIPNSLGQLSNLIELDVSNNSLVGVLSSIHFTKLNNLTALWLRDNSLTLNVSFYWIAPSQLKLFSASSCIIGPQFPSWFRKSTNLGFLDLSNSGIRDTIPEWFESISSHMYFLDLSHNQIGGNLTRIIMNPDLEYPGVSVLDLSDNQIGGNLPRIITNSGLDVVNLGKNRFTGSIPTHLCELLSIQLLDLSHNNFSGVFPKCLENLTHLWVLDLSNNTITGDLNSLGSLSYLESLHLHNNKFEGNLPEALQNLARLEFFDLGNNLLTGNIPSWIGKRLSKLRILNLQSNKLTGNIPLELCQNNALQHLNLANNSITGTVPYCFGNLNGMIMSGSNFRWLGIGNEEYIEAYVKGISLKYTKTARFLISLDLSSNKIIGEIPNVLMNLVALKNLNLSRNLLCGHIPEKIGDLKQMESLDLSTNKLSGQIPPSLASLNFLSYLNLSFNNLTGPIPVGNQLQTLGDPSTIYQGNTELCGPSLSRNCKENNLSYAHAREDEGKDGSHGFSWFYAGMVPGFVVGFMGLIGSLIFIRTWKVTYFQMIENVYDFLMISILVTLARLKRKIL